MEVMHTEGGFPPSMEGNLEPEEFPSGECNLHEHQESSIACGTNYSYQNSSILCNVTQDTFVLEELSQINDTAGSVCGSSGIVEEVLEADVLEVCVPADCVVKSSLEVGSDDLNETPNPLLSKAVVGDGSDSGCCCAGHVSSLQRALSSNSGGYASSCGGLEDTTPAVSCDSSLISCYSSYEDTEDIGTSTTVLLIHGGDGTSEGGSESSSVTGKDLEVRHKAASAKRSASANASRRRSDTAKTELDTGKPKTTPLSISKTSVVRQQVVVSHRTVASGPGHSSARKREKTGTVSASLSAGTRLHSDKPSQGGLSTKPSTRLHTASYSSARARSQAAVDSGSHGSAKKETIPLNLKNRNSSKLVCSARNKPEMSSSCDDNRWPSTCKSTILSTKSRGDGLTESLSKRATHSSSSSIGTNGTPVESKANALEKYATLPRRRRRESHENSAMENHQRSHSVSRDPSLNRAASLRKQRHQKDFTLSKTLPPYPRRKLPGRTKIFHEISVQTALTGVDVANALAGIGIQEYRPVGPIETQDQEIQVEKDQQELEHLTVQLKSLQADCDNQNQELHTAEAENLLLKEELNNRNKRVLALLGNVEERAEGVDILQELEVQLQSSGSTLVQQQHQISDLQIKCHILQRDLEKSLTVQRTLLQQQQEVETESMELHEFLQAEKLTLAEALQEGEAEISGLKQQLLQKEAEVQQQQEECKHLVRISEQRRQESLAYQARLSGIEKRSRELLLQQGAAVSGAAVALSGLTSRLDRLVEQLVASYDISQKDLEDVIFHNEAYSKSNSSVEASPEKTHDQLPIETPPKHGTSFVTAVISAIKNAASQSPFSSGSGKHGDPAQTSEEPSKCFKDPSSSPGCVDNYRLGNSESLHNLSQAILIRQQSEMAQHDDDPNDETSSFSYNKSEDASPILEECCSAASLVDQIIEVDNLVTKLLKVLRILQLENETCIGDLTDERTQLAEQMKLEQNHKKETADALWEWECRGARLHNEVEDARSQLQLKTKELEKTKLDLQQHREEVEHLNQDVYRLSTLCQKAELQLRSHEEEAQNALKQWQETGHLPPAETLARILTACNEEIQRSLIH